MAGADFDAVPSLAAAMGLEKPVYTHVGYQPRCGYLHLQVELHRAPFKAVHGHACNGGPDLFAALCGATVALRRFNEWGEPARPNVRPIEDPDAGRVTCKRCLKAISNATK